MNNQHTEHDFHCKKQIRNREVREVKAGDQMARKKQTIRHRPSFRLVKVYNDILSL